ncbi:MAG TPA: energy transducer TonB [Myxococcota bacterium]|nr:energy transducer TonB [Myxococcota bacterium]HRY95055.1 energy transducer TonB [Myxococcota bacterium]HSA20484.1 energy transducer TonB [Myxococcota bacterium]
MQVRKNDTDWKPLGLAALAVVLLHLQLVLSDWLPAALRYWQELVPPPQHTAPTRVDFMPLSKAEFAQLAREARTRSPDGYQPPKRAPGDRPEELAQAPEPKEPEPPKPPEPPKKENWSGQVVDVAPTPDDRPPEDARFLSEHNTRVEKETISRDRRPDYNVAQPRPTVAKELFRQVEAAEATPGRDLVALHMRKRGERLPEPPAEPAESRLEIPDRNPREALKLQLDLDFGSLASYAGSEGSQGNSDRLRLQLGRAGQPAEGASESGDGGADEQTLSLLKKPSLDALSMVTGAPANDHVEDVPQGAETLLNSREFKYATFFNRVKRGVSETWSPRVTEEYLRRDPYGNVYGVSDRYTLLNVALDLEGKVGEISVQRSSGVSFFDDVAVEAFQAASPFPNPPRALADPDGMIRFQFGFFFQIGERPMLRAFRFDSRDF